MNVLHASRVIRFYTELKEVTSCMVQFLFFFLIHAWPLKSYFHALVDSGSLVYLLFFLQVSMSS